MADRVQGLGRCFPCALAREHLEHSSAVFSKFFLVQQVSNLVSFRAETFSGPLDPDSVGGEVAGGLSQHASLLTPLSVNKPHPFRFHRVLQANPQERGSGVSRRGPSGEPLSFKPAT